jgi:hypothetical protein
MISTMISTIFANVFFILCPILGNDPIGSMERPGFDAQYDSFGLG